MLMRTRRTAEAAVLAAAMVLMTGCGGGGRGDGPEEANGTLEEIAAKAACEPELRPDAAELRQASCATGDGTYVLLTFASDRGQREWLNEAKDYGGSYLVGRKWTVAGDARTVERVRERLGGQIETAEPHAPHPSHTGGHH